MMARQEAVRAGAPEPSATRGADTAAEAKLVMTGRVTASELRVSARSSLANLQ